LRVPGANVHEVIQVHRRHIVESMQKFWRLKAEMADDDIGLALIADAEMFRLNGIVRWLDAADIRLKRYTASQDAPPSGDTRALQAPFQLPRPPHWQRAGRREWRTSDDGNARNTPGIEDIRDRRRPGRRA
jgi:hypothetical protein